MTALQDPLKTITHLFDASGTLRYGEHVNQIEHALQCALLAQLAGASDELVVAALLHDVGHLLHRDARGALLAAVGFDHVWAQGVGIKLGYRQRVTLICHTGNGPERFNLIWRAGRHRHLSAFFGHRHEVRQWRRGQSRHLGLVIPSAQLHGGTRMLTGLKLKGLRL